MHLDKIVQVDPDSLAFFQAAKSARPKGGRANAQNGPRTKSRAFQ